MSTKLRFAIPTVLVIAIAVSLALTNSDAAFGQSGTGGTGPEPTTLPNSVSPATATPLPTSVPDTATPEAATATAEPTVAPTTTPPTATASPEPTVEPTAVPTYTPEQQTELDLIYSALAVIVGRLDGMPTEAEWDVFIDGWIQAGLDRENQIDQLNLLATYIDAYLSATPTPVPGPSNTDIMLYLNAMRGEVRDIRDKVYEPTPTPTATAVVTPGPGGATVVEICNQCSIAP